MNKLNICIKCDECLFIDICKYKDKMTKLSDAINGSIDTSVLSNISRVMLECSFYKGSNYYSTMKNYNL